MKKLSNGNVEPLFEQSLCLLMLFCLWLILKKKCWDLRQICLLNLQIFISFLIQLLPILITAKKEYLTVKLLRFNTVCSDDLEKWLLERGYNQKMVCKQILRASEHSRNDLLEREKPQMPE